MICHTQSTTGLTVTVTSLEDGIFHLQAAGLDGPMPSLLDRYGFIEKLAPNDSAEVSDDAGDQVLHSDGHTLRLKSTGMFELCRDGQVLMRTLESTRPGTAQTFTHNQGYHLDLMLHDAEKIIGFGDHHRKSFILNGRCDDLWIKYPIKHVPVPFFMSSRGYGVFFNTTRRLTYDIAATGPKLARFAVARDYLDVYIIPGRDYQQMIRRYTKLTGRPAMPPLKSLGLWLIMHTQATGHDVLMVARTLREAGIPCDNLSLEPGWMQTRYDYSLNKEWNSDKFRGTPTGSFRRGAERMIHALNRMGYDLGLWLCCNYDLTHEEERRLAPTPSEETALDDDFQRMLDGVQISHLDENVGHAPIRMDTVTRPNEAWFDHLKKFVDDGVRFFKVDPAVLINEFPDRLYGNDKHDDEMHNIAFMLCSKQMHDDYEKYTGKRAWGISVAGWAGVQRYPGTWTGDTGGGEQALVGILQDALMGHAFTTCDMDAMCIQGIHLGFLLPWSLINSWTSFHYPGYQGDDIDSAYRDYGRLRMQLLPYLYTAAHQATQTGMPIVRPMLLMHPDREEAYPLTHQYYLGDNLLVGAFDNTIVLPPGRWYNYWTGQVHHGNWDRQAIDVPKLRGGPLLVREGAIIPTVVPARFTKEKPWQRITWLCFLGDQPATATVYLDQGDGLAYRNGAWARQTIRYQPSADRIALTLNVPEGQSDFFDGIVHDARLLDQPDQPIEVHVTR